MTPLSIKEYLARASALAVVQKQSGTKHNQTALDKICSTFETFARRGDQAQKNLAQTLVTDLFESKAANRPEHMVETLYPVFVLLCGIRTSSDRPCTIDWSLLCDLEPVSAAA